MAVDKVLNLKTIVYFLPMLDKEASVVITRSVILEYKRSNWKLSLVSI